MDNYSNTLQLVLKYWPTKTNENDPLVRKFAEIATLASLEEQDIAEFCELLEK